MKAIINRMVHRVFQKLKEHFYRSILLWLIGNEVEIAIDNREEKRKHYRGIWIRFPEKEILTYWIYLKGGKYGGRTIINFHLKKV